MPRIKATLLLLSLATAFVPAFAQNTSRAVPGSLNYVQGQATLDGQPVTSYPDFNNPRQLRAGEILATANGSADVLLAPGALLRIGPDSALRMIEAAPDHAEVRLERGLANASVNLISPRSLLLIDFRDGQTQLLTPGLYAFRAATSTMQVFNGEADAFPGAETTTDIKPVKVKEGHQVVFTTDRPRAESFDRNLAENDLLPWTGPREASAALADAAIGEHAGSGYVSNYPAAGFYDSYAYGDPYYGGYSYGYPYGWGPYGFAGYPFFGVGFGFYGGGWYGGGYHYVRPVPYPRGGYGGYGRGGFAGHPFTGGGFSGGHAFTGGGFRGGGSGHR